MRSAREVTFLDYTSCARNKGYSAVWSVSAFSSDTLKRSHEKNVAVSIQVKCCLENRSNAYTSRYIMHHGNYADLCRVVKRGIAKIPAKI